jgi:hypothetical protein
MDLQLKGLKAIVTGGTRASASRSRERLSRKARMSPFARATQPASRRRQARWR